MVKLSPLEAAVAGFVIVMDAVPAAGKSDAGMATLRWVASTRVVVRGDPFQCTVAPVARLLPVTTRLRLPLPCAVLVTAR